MNVQGPGGLLVRFPDGTSPSIIDRVMRQALAKAPASFNGQPVTATMDPQFNPMAAAKPPPAAPDNGPGYVGDTLKSGASGLIEGVHGLAGIGGDMETAARTGVDYLQQLWRGSGMSSMPSRAQMAQAVGKPDPGMGPIDPLLPTTAEVEKFTGFHPYQPQTGIGKIVRQIGAFIPAAAASGGAGTLEQLIKTAVLPATISEGAGQAVEAVDPNKTDADIARLVGGFSGGVAGSFKPVMSGPAGEQLAAEAKRLIEAAKAQGVMVKPEAMQQFAENLGNDLKDQGSFEGLTPRTIAATKAISDAAASPLPTSLDDLEKLRRVVGVAGNTVDPNEIRLTSIMRNHMDDFLDSLASRPEAVAAGNPQAAIPLLKQFRLNWARKKAGDMVDQAMYRAQNSSAWDAGNKQQAIRTQFRKIVDNAKQMRFFPPAQRNALIKAVRGSWPEDITGWLAKFSPLTHTRSAITGATIGTLAGGASGNLGAAGTVMGALGSGGIVAQGIANAIAKRDAEIAGTIVRGGSIRYPKRLPLWINQANMATRSPNAGN